LAATAAALSIPHSLGFSVLVNNKTRNGKRQKNNKILKKTFEILQPNQNSNEINSKRNHIFEEKT